MGWDIKKQEEKITGMWAIINTKNLMKIFK
jgi:hypothetical protein